MPKNRVVKQDERYPLEPLFGRILSPFEQFLHRTTAGGIVLIGCTIAALVLATAFGAAAIHNFTDKPLALFASEALTLGLSVHEWINDGLMTFFFLLVGLELKREILVGELSSLKDAALPVVAALGGMILPALCYAVFNAGTPAASGWGIPVATDIAFAVGILILLAWRVPKNLIIFLTALAIADDLGAVLVIAAFYTAELDLYALALAASLPGRRAGSVEPRRHPPSPSLRHCGRAALVRSSHVWCACDLGGRPARHGDPCPPGAYPRAFRAPYQGTAVSIPRGSPRRADRGRSAQQSAHGLDRPRDGTLRCCRAKPAPAHRAPTSALGNVPDHSCICTVERGHRSVKRELEQG